MEHWHVTSSPERIVITCRGHDKTGSARAAAETFRALAARELASFSVLADLREMTGYETNSRQAWQEAFRAERSRIQTLVLIGAQSSFIRMGAAVVGAFAGIPVRFVATWDEVEPAPRRKAK